MQLPALPPERASAAHRRKPRVGVVAPGLLALLSFAGALTALLGAAPAAHAQSVVWTQTFDYHSDYESTPAKIARDSNGNIIVASTSAYNSVDSNYDWTVSKYTSAGVKIWTGTFDSPNTGASVSSGFDSVTAMTVDTSNNIYVTGSSPQGVNRGTDWVTVKFNGADGTRAWANSYGSAYFDAPAAIARDSAQNVYVVGTTQFNVEGTDTDIALVKYSPTGAILYQAGFDSPDAGVTGVGRGLDSAYGLVVDAAGLTTVVGVSEQGASRKKDGVVIRFDANGARTWATVLNGNGGDDGFYSIARDSAGNIYAAGQRFYTDDNSDYDALLAKYDTAGTLVWTRNVDGPHFTGVATSGYDSADKLLVDGSNNIYIAGTVSVNNGYNDAFLAKYNNAGTLLWEQRYDYHSYNESVAALVRDSVGNVYLGVTGQYTPGGGDSDWKILKYSSTGSLLSSPLYDRAQKYDALGDLVIDNTVSTRDFYAVGTGEASTGAKPYDLIIQKWSQVAVDPTLQPYDMSVGQDNKPRILWNRLNAVGITLWTVTPTGTSDNGKAYTLPAGWTAVAQTIGTDNKMRFLLEETATHKVAIWRFSENILTLENGVLYGPVNGYTIREISISPDGRMRLVWKQNTTERIAFWTIPVTGSGLESGVTINPPAAGYTFRKLSFGNDGVARLLWTSVSGGAYLSTLNAGNSAVANNTAYTLAGYSPLDISVGSENKARILWDDGGGSIKIARYTVAGSAIDGTPIALGPYTALTPVSLWLGKGDNKARIMWRYDDQRMVLMRLTTAGVIEQQNTYGPY